MNECHAEVVRLRGEEREHGVAALGDKSPLCGDEHPFTIVLKASRSEARLIEVDHATRFDRIDMQRVDAKSSGVHVLMIALQYRAAVAISRATIGL